MYEAQADTIDVDDIATNSNNRIVMRRMKNNVADNSKLLWIQNEHDVDGEDCVDYVPEGANDMGWLGYFVGKNEHLEEVVIYCFIPTSGSSVRDVMEPFFRGISHNKSIQEIYLFGSDVIWGGEVFTMLTPFFKNNHNLTNIIINECDFGDEGGRLFALAIGSSTHKSLKKVQLENNNISAEGMVDIITALSMHPNLNSLNLIANRLRKNGCVALATLLQCSAKELQNLLISGNDIDDEGIEALVPALVNCNHLKELYLCNNPSITTRGWQSHATLLESNSILEQISIGHNDIDDRAVAAFASALTNNHTLNTLELDYNPSISPVGWEAFSHVLCNPSSVNATFLSNHTLRYVADEVYGNEIVGPLFDLNGRNDKKEVATIKILQAHDDFDMQPFFEWEFKVLPLVLSWLEIASACQMPPGFLPNIEQRKLSTIYQFVRGMPVLYVETRLRKELEDIKLKRRKWKRRSS